MSFFPQLPVRIPFTPGLPIWWDVFWWAFQILVMTSLLLYFNRIADGLDQQRIRGMGDKGRPKK